MARIATFPVLPTMEVLVVMPTEPLASTRPFPILTHFPLTNASKINFLPALEVPVAMLMTTELPEIFFLAPSHVRFEVVLPELVPVEVVKSMQAHCAQEETPPELYAAAVRQ